MTSLVAVPAPLRSGLRKVKSSRSQLGLNGSQSNQAFMRHRWTSLTHEAPVGEQTWLQPVEAFGPSCGSWHLCIGSRCFESCRLHDGTYKDQVFCPTDAGLYWELGTLVAGSPPWALCPNPRVIARAHCPAGVGHGHHGVYLVCNSVWMGGVCSVASTWIPEPKDPHQNKWC